MLFVEEFEVVGDGVEIKVVQRVTEKVFEDKFKIVVNEEI